MGRFSRTLAAKKKKSNNHPASRDAKIALRAAVLDAIGEDQARVFDAFAGEGQMHAAVWHRAASYTGCDLEFYRDDRLAFVADNLRVLRAVDLGQFNVFDLDAYGSPWHQALIVAARRPVEPGETIGLILTEGSGLTIKMSGMPTALRILTGFKGMPGLNKAADELLKRAIQGLCDRMHCEAIHSQVAKGKTGASVYYVGLVLRGHLR
jgi:hypothetical protein